ncbi:MAG TPA: hypothetical protein VHM20_08060 [Gammaproteobacteria bacterium]|jgi:DNA-binding protein Fis|nr:hypothetical protein [Gammaproteobacteria bacterium]
MIRELKSQKNESNNIYEEIEKLLTILFKAYCQGPNNRDLCDEIFQNLKTELLEALMNHTHYNPLSMFSDLRDYRHITHSPRVPRAGKG